MYKIQEDRLIILDEELGIDLNVPLEGSEGLLHGPSRFFSPEGQLLSESWFCLGKLEGKVKQYYASGKLASLQRYRGGIPCLLHEYYYEDGTLKTIMPYEDGLLHGVVKLFWPSGALKREVHFHQGKQTGVDQILDEKGEPIV